MDAKKIRMLFYNLTDGNYIIFTSHDYTVLVFSLSRSQMLLTKVFIPTAPKQESLNRRV